MSNSVIIVGGFGDEEMIPTLCEGFSDVGCMVGHMPSRGVIAEHWKRDSQFAAKEIIASVSRTTFQYQTQAEWVDTLRTRVDVWQPRLLLWWYAKDDRPAGLVESLKCPTVRFSFDDPMAIDVYGEDFSRGFTHAVTSCKDSLKHYAERGVKAIHSLPPVSPTRHGQAKPTPGEFCDIGFSFFTLYNGEAPYLKERAKRHDLIEAAATLPARVHVYGRRERFGRGFAGIPDECYRGFKTTNEMPGIFAASKITVSQHPQYDAAGYVNPRTMEAIASGTFVIADETAGMQEYLPDVPQYASCEHFADLAAGWLRHMGEAQQAAQRTRRRVLEECSGKRFAERLLEHCGC